MKEQVDALIYNTLCKNESLWIPEVGTLIVRRVAPEQTSSKRIEAPRREVLFTGERRGLSLIDVVANAANLPEERATAICEQWHQQSLKDGVVTIGGVGTIANREFTAAPELTAALNPAKKALKLRSRTPWGVYTFAVLCVLAAVGTALYVLYSEQLFAERMGKSELEVEAENVVTEAVVPIADDVQSTVVEEVAEVVDAAPAVQEAEPAVETSTLSPVAMPMSKGCSYAVWGVYSEEANATHYKALLAERYADIEPRIFEYKGRYMVAIYETSMRSECVKLVDLLKSSDKAFKEVWVYTNR